MNYVMFIFLILSALCIFSIMIILQRRPPRQKNTPSNERNFCINHNDKRTTSLCHICNAPFCEDCIKNHTTLSFCLEHFRLLEKYQWIPILSFQINAEESQDGLILQNFKEMIWKKEKIPSYIVVEYRINFEEDLIESHISYFTRKQDQDLLIEKYQDFRERA
jgi:hypothetical protein